MRRIALVGLILVPLFLLSSCTSVVWISNPYSEYPKESYVCAVGYGKTTEEADSEARKNLASLFGMEVKATITSTMVETTLKQDGMTINSFSELFSNDTSISVAVDNLYGVEIVNRANSSNGDFISLAVMDKKTTSDYYRAKMQSDKATTENLEHSIMLELGTFQGVRDSVMLINAYEEYNTSTVIYGYLSGETQEYISLSLAQDLLRTAKDSIILEVDVEGDESGVIKSTVSKVFTDYGFAISNNASSPSAHAVITINWRQTTGTGVASPFLFANFDADVSLVDVMGDETVLVLTLSGKEGHQTYEGAKARAIDSLSESLAKEFRSVLSDYY